MRRRGDEEGVGSEALPLLSLDTHSREVTGAHGVNTQSRCWIEVAL